jgi:hypothetical protein
MAAARWGHASIVQMLLDKYISAESALTRFVNATDGDRNNALMHASKHGHLSSMRLLLHAKSSHFAALRVSELDAQNKCNPLLHAAVPVALTNAHARVIDAQGWMDCAHAGGARGLC